METIKERIYNTIFDLDKTLIICNNAGICEVDTFEEREKIGKMLEHATRIFPCDESNQEYEIAGKHKLIDGKLYTTYVVKQLNHAYTFSIAVEDDFSLLFDDCDYITEEKCTGTFSDCQFFFDTHKREFIEEYRNGIAIIYNDTKEENTATFFSEEIAKEIEL